MELIIGVAFGVIMAFVVLFAIIFNMTYQVIDKFVNNMVELPFNSDCGIENAITDAEIIAEEAEQDVRLKKL